MRNEDRALARYPENMREALRLLASVVLRLNAGRAGRRPPFSPTVPRIRDLENGNPAKKELL